MTVTNRNNPEHVQVDPPVTCLSERWQERLRANPLKISIHRVLEPNAETCVPVLVVIKPIAKTRSPLREAG